MKVAMEIVKNNNSSQTPQAKRSICVFCGASKAVDEHYYALAKTVGEALAARNYRLVYGGGSIGLMGASALAAHEAGGDVLGIIPQFLADIEEILTVIEHRIVKDMHQRKHQMYEESDAYIVLPGGIGTLEEAIEVMSWMRLHLHAKPMVFVDTDGYWAPLMQLLNHTIDARFSPAWVRGHLFYEQSIDAALKIIEDQWVNPAPKGEIKVEMMDKV
jgi:uncharacterized protein (TIGR00730 family)